MVFTLAGEIDCFQYFAPQMMLALGTPEESETPLPLAGDNVVETDIWYSY